MGSILNKNLEGRNDFMMLFNAVILANLPSSNLFARVLMLFLQLILSGVLVKEMDVSH